MLSLEAFRLLWRRLEIEEGDYALTSFFLPDTVVIVRGEIQEWYFSSARQCRILKKNSENRNIRAILQSFCRGQHPLAVVALLRYFELSPSLQLVCTTRYLVPAQLEDLLLHLGESKLTGIIQKVISRMPELLPGERPPGGSGASSSLAGFSNVSQISQASQSSNLSMASLASEDALGGPGRPGGPWKPEGPGSSLPPGLPRYRRGAAVPGSLESPQGWDFPSGASARNQRREGDIRVQSADLVELGIEEEYSPDSYPSAADSASEIQSQFVAREGAARDAFSGSTADSEAGGSSDGSSDRESSDDPVNLSDRRDQAGWSESRESSLSSSASTVDRGADAASGSLRKGEMARGESFVRSVTEAGAAPLRDRHAALLPTQTQSGQELQVIRGTRASLVNQDSQALRTAQEATVPEPRSGFAPLPPCQRFDSAMGPADLSSQAAMVIRVHWTREHTSAEARRPRANPRQLRLDPDRRLSGFWVSSGYVAVSLSPTTVQRLHNAFTLLAIHISAQKQGKSVEGILAYVSIVDVPERRQRELGEQIVFLFAESVVVGGQSLDAELYAKLLADPLSDMMRARVLDFDVCRLVYNFLTDSTALFSGGKAPERLFSILANSGYGEETGVILRAEKRATAAEKAFWRLGADLRGGNRPKAFRFINKMILEFYSHMEAQASDMEAQAELFADLERELERGASWGREGPGSASAHREFSFGGSGKIFSSSQASQAQQGQRDSRDPRPSRSPHSPRSSLAPHFSAFSLHTTAASLLSADRLAAPECVRCQRVSGSQPIALRFLLAEPFAYLATKYPIFRPLYAAIPLADMYRVLHLMLTGDAEVVRGRDSIMLGLEGLLGDGRGEGKGRAEGKAAGGSRAGWRTGQSERSAAPNASKTQPMRSMRPIRPKTAAPRATSVAEPPGFAGISASRPSSGLARPASGAISRHTPIPPLAPAPRARPVSYRDFLLTEQSRHVRKPGTGFDRGAGEYKSRTHDNDNLRLVAMVDEMLRMQTSVLLPLNKLQPFFDMTTETLLSCVPTGLLQRCGETILTPEGFLVRLDDRNFLYRKLWVCDRCATEISQALRWLLE